MKMMNYKEIRFFRGSPQIGGVKIVKDRISECMLQKLYTLDRSGTFLILRFHCFYTRCLYNVGVLGGISLQNLKLY